MIRIKPASSRRREMREDLSLLMGIQRAHKIRRFSPKSGNQCQRVGFANHRSSATVTRCQPDPFQQPEPVQFPDDRETKPSMFLAPAARVGSLKPKNSRWPACSSEPITRIGNINPDGFRQPMSFMLNGVQPPPATPFVVGPDSEQDENDVNPNFPNLASAMANNNSLLQSPWVNRTSFSSEDRTPLSEITSKYSVMELIDSLCGDGPQIPEIIERFPRKIAAKRETAAQCEAKFGPFGPIINNGLFVEPVSLPPALFDNPDSGYATPDITSESFLPPMPPQSPTLFEAPSTILKPSLINGMGEAYRHYKVANLTKKPKSVTFMDVEPTILPDSLFSPAPSSTNFTGENISTPPSTTSTDSSSPSEATTFADVSPFFTTGLDFIQKMYDGCGGDESPTNQQVQHLF